MGHGCLTGTLAATPQGDDDRGFDRLLIPAGQTKPLALLPTAEWLKSAPFPGGAGPDGTTKGEEN